MTVTYAPSDYLRYLPPPGDYFDECNLLKIFGNLNFNKGQNCGHCLKAYHDGPCNRACGVCKKKDHQGKYCPRRYCRHTWYSQWNTTNTEGFSSQYQYSQCNATNINCVQIRPGINPCRIMAELGMIKRTFHLTDEIVPNTDHSMVKEFYGEKWPRRIYDFNASPTPPPISASFNPLTSAKCSQRLLDKQHSPNTAEDQTSDINAEAIGDLQRSNAHLPTTRTRASPANTIEYGRAHSSFISANTVNARHVSAVPIDTAEDNAQQKGPARRVCASSFFDSPKPLTAYSQPAGASSTDPKQHPNALTDSLGNKVNHHSPPANTIDTKATHVGRLPVALPPEFDLKIPKTGAPQSTQFTPGSSMGNGTIPLMPPTSISPQELAFHSARSALYEERIHRLQDQLQLAHQAAHQASTRTTELQMQCADQEQRLFEKDLEIGQLKAKIDEFKGEAGGKRRRLN